MIVDIHYLTSAKQPNLQCSLYYLLSLEYLTAVSSKATYTYWIPVWHNVFKEIIAKECSKWYLCSKCYLCSTLVWKYLWKIWWGQFLGVLPSSHLLYRLTGVKSVLWNCLLLSKIISWQNSSCMAMKYCEDKSYLTIPLWVDVVAMHTKLYWRDSSWGSVKIIKVLWLWLLAFLLRFAAERCKIPFIYIVD